MLVMGLMPEVGAQAQALPVVQFVLGWVLVEGGQRVRLSVQLVQRALAAAVVLRAGLVAVHPHRHPAHH